jgi:hypothetical protein
MLSSRASIISRRGLLAVDEAVAGIRRPLAAYNVLAAAPSKPN